MFTEDCELHNRLFKVDTHLDTPTARLTRTDWDFSLGHEFSVDRSQCDLPRLRTGGADAVVFAAYVGQAARTPAGYAAAHALAVRAITRTLEVIAQNHGECALAKSAGEALRIKDGARRAIFISIENAYSLGIDGDSLTEFYQFGVRMIGLTHMLNNDIADSSTDPRGPEWGGLSPLGREVVAECNRLGILIDASHASDSALRDLLAVSRLPVILSHSGCRAVCDHPRNIGDDLLRALASKGGVISINALPAAVVSAPANGRSEAFGELLLRYQDAVPTPEVLAAEDADYARVSQRFPSPVATLEDYIRHVEHAVEVAGIEHVGIGCDFDGGGGVTGLNDVSEYPNLTRALLARGWSEPDLAKLWGGNVLRVMPAQVGG